MLGEPDIGGRIGSVLVLETRQRKRQVQVVDLNIYTSDHPFFLTRYSISNSVVHVC